MKYYPVYLNIQRQSCLVVGGGNVATRKVIMLLDCNANVTVVSPEISDTLTSLANDGLIVLKLRNYQVSDIEDVFLVIGATNNAALNRTIHEDAGKRGKLCNIVDQPDLCNFILPSIVHRGDLIIAVSTSGKSPAFARELRKQLEMQFGPEYADFLNLMGEIRNRLLQKGHDPEGHRKIFKQLIDKGLLDFIRNGQEEQIDALLMSILGPEQMMRPQ
jgi:precorrin-2 dehydrogenase / sirohydrochlorin ferrochelatase